MKNQVKVERLCRQLEHLAADRQQIHDTQLALEHLSERLCAQQEDIEQEVMDLLNTGESKVVDIGRLRFIFQTTDQYTSRPCFEVRYPDYCCVGTKRHFLRKPGQKARPKK